MIVSLLRWSWGSALYYFHQRRSAGGTAPPQAETENGTGRSIQQLFEATVGRVSRWTGPAVGTQDVRFETEDILPHVLFFLTNDSPTVKREHQQVRNQHVGVGDTPYSVCTLVYIGATGV